MDEMLTPTLNAITEVLSRHWLSESRIGDADQARQLSRSLLQRQCPPELLAIATGGTWAAFQPDGELEEEVVGEILVVARLMIRTDIPDHIQALASVSLAIMALRGMSKNPGSDLVLAAEGAQRIEHHDVALRAARGALSRSPELSPRDNAIARILIARMTTDPADVDAAVTSVSMLSADDPLVHAAISIRSTRRTAETGRLRSAGEAAASRDRPGAAAAILEDVGKLVVGESDQAFINGFHQAMTCLAQPSIDAEQLRRALIELVRQLRRRQRFGRPAPASLAGIDMVLHVMLAGSSDDGSENVLANVIIELMEALADAGLSEADPRQGGDILAAVAQAHFADSSRSGVIWPDITEAISGLGGTRALLFYTHTSLSGRLSVLAAHLEPPDGVALRRTALSDENAALLGRFIAADPIDLTQISESELNRLVEQVLPTVFREKLTDEPQSDLIIVPVGPLWAVPWEAAPLLRAARVARVPSLSVHARLQPAGRIRTVRAIIDDSAPGGAEVYDALYDARASGSLNVDFVGSPASEHDVDLLLVYGHGHGEGLQFRTGTDGELTAHDIARLSGAHAAIIAACWSAGPPPLAFPASLPSAMLLTGTSAVAGGMWPLPAWPTAEILVETIKRLSDGESVIDAIVNTRRARSRGLFNTWGLTVHGRMR